MGVTFFPKKILILCTGNSCRSQIAHAYFEHFTDRLTTSVYSAGIETHGLNPRAVQTMQEDGIDISHYTSNSIDEYADIVFDFVITVCDNARERCPYFPTKAQQFHRNFPDPARSLGSESDIMAQFRSVREDVKRYVSLFIEQQQLGKN